MAHLSIQQTCNLLKKPRKFVKCVVDDQHRIEEIESKFYDYYEQIRGVKV
jgi:hypothetical protein